MNIMLFVVLAILHMFYLSIELNEPGFLNVIFKAFCYDLNLQALVTFFKGHECEVREEVH